MNKPTTLEERRQIGTLADLGMTDRGIAARLSTRPAFLLGRFSGGTTLWDNAATTY